MSPPTIVPILHRLVECSREFVTPCHVGMAQAVTSNIKVPVNLPNSLFPHSGLGGTRWPSEFKCRVLQI